MAALDGAEELPKWIFSEADEAPLTKWKSSQKEKVGLDLWFPLSPKSKILLLTYHRFR